MLFLTIFEQRNRFCHQPEFQGKGYSHIAISPSLASETPPGASPSASVEGCQRDAESHQWYSWLLWKLVYSENAPNCDARYLLA